MDECILTIWAVKGVDEDVHYYELHKKRSHACYTSDYFAVADEAYVIEKGINKSHFFNWKIVGFKFKEK